jgi:hypothetical protein
MFGERLLDEPVFAVDVSEGHCAENGKLLKLNDKHVTPSASGRPQPVGMPNAYKNCQFVNKMQNKPFQP